MKYYVQTPGQLSAALKSRRKELQRTQHKVAESVGLLQKTVSKLENHVESSSVENLLKLLSALDFGIILEPRDRTADDADELEW
jgi:transcriptional regulator with XRE-family HTH domain